MVDNLLVFTMLCLLVAGCEWLVRHTWAKYLGTALLVIVLTAIFANTGILPAGATAERPIANYDGIYQYLALISIFWLLLGVNLRDILKAGLPVIGLFLIGSLGNPLGTFLGFWVASWALPYLF